MIPESGLGKNEHYDMRYLKIFGQKCSKSYSRAFIESKKVQSAVRSRH